MGKLCIIMLSQISTWVRFPGGIFSNILLAKEAGLKDSLVCVSLNFVIILRRMSAPQGDQNLQFQAVGVIQT